MNISAEERGLDAAEQGFYLAARFGLADSVVERLNGLSRDPEYHEAVVSLGNAALRGLDDDAPYAERHKDDIARVVSDVDRTITPREIDEQDTFYLAALAFSRDPYSFLGLLEGSQYEGDYEKYQETLLATYDAARQVDKRVIEHARNLEWAQSLKNREFYSSLHGRGIIHNVPLFIR